MDVVEIGERQLDMGGVYAVKPLAVLAMIDDGELDWKVVAIRADDPKAAAVNDVEDVERCGTMILNQWQMPSCLSALVFPARRLYNGPQNPQTCKASMLESNRFPPVARIAGDPSYASHCEASVRLQHGRSTSLWISHTVAQPPLPKNTSRAAQAARQLPCGGVVVSWQGIPG